MSLGRIARRASPIAAIRASAVRAPAFDPDADARLRQAVRDDSDVTLEELGRRAGVTCSASAVYRALDRLGITRKKSHGGRPSRTAPS